MRDNRLTRSLLSLVLALALAPAVEAAVVTQAQGNDVGTLSGTASVSSATVAAVASDLSSQETTPVATSFPSAHRRPATPSRPCGSSPASRRRTALPVPDATVVIEKVASTRTVLGSGSTDASGTFAISVAPTSRIVLEARFAGAGDLLPSTSPLCAIKPRVLLGTPWTHDAIAYPGQRLPARGSLWPAHAAGSPGTTIVCERYESGKWVRRATYSATVVDSKSGSRYRGVFKLPSPGKWRVRAKHVDDGHAETLGPAHTVVVKDWRKRYVGKRLRWVPQITRRWWRSPSTTVPTGAPWRSARSSSDTTRRGPSSSLGSSSTGVRSQAQPRLRPRARDRQPHRESQDADGLVRDARTGRRTCRSLRFAPRQDSIPSGSGRWAAASTAPACGRW